MIVCVLRKNNLPVEYVSILLKKSQKKNYTITERETLAAIWLREKFEFLFTGKEFYLISDHKALEFIEKKHNFRTARIDRWIERFNRFEFNRIYRERSRMTLMYLVDLQSTISTLIGVLNKK